MSARKIAGWAVGGMAAGALATAAWGQIGRPLTATLGNESVRIRDLRTFAPKMLALPNLNRAQYVDRLRKAFNQRDTNQDMYVSWQKAGSGETLPAFKQCVIVKYQSIPGSTTKDPAHPGQFIETAAATVPADWEYLLDRLAATKFDGGKCEVIKVEAIEQCVVAGKKVADYTVAAWKLETANLGLAALCKLPGNKNSPSCYPPTYKMACEKHGGEYASVDKMTGCEKFTTYGPDSTEALVRVANASFDAEDWNKNGIIDGAEGEFLCPAS